jgi:hypothetical protein
MGCVGPAAVGCASSGLGGFFAAASLLLRKSIRYFIEFELVHFDNFAKSDDFTFYTDLCFKSDHVFLVLL